MKKGISDEGMGRIAKVIKGQEQQDLMTEDPTENPFFWSVVESIDTLAREVLRAAEETEDTTAAEAIVDGVKASLGRMGEVGEMAMERLYRFLR